MNLREPELTNVEMLHNLWDETNELKKFEDSTKTNNEQLDDKYKKIAYKAALLESINKTIADVSSKILSMTRLLYVDEKMSIKYNIDIDTLDIPENIKDIYKDLVYSIRGMANYLDKDGTVKYIEIERQSNEKD